MTVVTVTIPTATIPQTDLLTPAYPWTQTPTQKHKLP